MSTTDRSRTARSRAARAAAPTAASPAGRRAAGGDEVAAPRDEVAVPGDEVAAPGDQVAAPTPRVVRVRNVCLVHAAAHLGLALPSEAELAALPADLTLTQCAGWLQTRRVPAGGATDGRAGTRAKRARTGARARVGIRARAGVILLRVARVSLIVAGALALTYGRAQ